MATAHRSKAEIEALRARRFPRPELLPLVESLPAPAPLADPQLARAQVDALAPASMERLAPERVELSAPGRMEAAAPRSQMTPHAPRRYALQAQARAAAAGQAQERE